jgi:metallophosphoesterase superfamily enzyme
VLVLPAFSPIFPGSDILAVPQSALLSPILRKYGIDNMKVYACLENEILEFPDVGVMKQHV